MREVKVREDADVIVFVSRDLDIFSDLYWSSGGETQRGGTAANCFIPDAPPTNSKYSWSGRLMLCM